MGHRGGDWDGPIFVLTHHPEDATPVNGIRLYDNPGSTLIQFHPTAELNVRYRPARKA